MHWQHRARSQWECLVVGCSREGVHTGVGDTGVALPRLSGRGTRVPDWHRPQTEALTSREAAHPSPHRLVWVGVTSAVWEPASSSFYRQCPRDSSPGGCSGTAAVRRVESGPLRDKSGTGTLLTVHIPLKRHNRAGSVRRKYGGTAMLWEL